MNKKDKAEIEKEYIDALESYLYHQQICVFAKNNETKKGEYREMYIDALEASIYYQQIYLLIETILKDEEIK